ncbi:class I SAM-dependent methyltransferase [Bradyrhizobium brasilense]|uniref:class I SAM-dependent methyltransferase n=1 Tax=Bradyrhizobium brasilense TaxID=1419277 RepID=UPI002877363E|nr:class I SAM-dependent methyltransferase [Bradyrhizobium brasilense]MCP3417227.1 class I SAM-dependent methyltransferase [Bradyrhizobium brasilense]
MSIAAETAGVGAEGDRARFSDLYADVESYYSARIAKYGATPRGVDWSCQATQDLRFVQLLKLCDFSAPFSLNDIGCGYGALCAYLTRRHPQAEIDYLGIDLSLAMISRARRRFSAPGRRFKVGKGSLRRATYSVASGIMNVDVGGCRRSWEAFVAGMLADLRRASLRGFSVNFVTGEADGTAADDASPVQLYCTSPEPWIDYCERELGCTVETIDGYGLNEVTLLARCRDC